MSLEDSLVVLGSNTAVVGSISDDYVSSSRQENFDGGSDGDGMGLETAASLVARSAAISSLN